jgi:hypothetical protein
VAAGAALAISGGDPLVPKVLDGRTLTNGGAATWSGADVSATNGAVFNNPGTLALAGDVSLTTDFGGGVTAAFNNGGVLQKAAPGTGTSSLAATLANSGTVSVTSGTLTLAAGGTAAGSFAVAAGAALNFGDPASLGGARFSRAAGAGVSGAGNVTFGSGGAEVLGGYAVTGTTTAAGAVTFYGAASTGDFNDQGSVVIGPDAALTVSGGYTQTGVASTALLGGRLTAATVNIQGGAFVGLGAITGNVTLSGGVLLVGGPVNPDGSAVTAVLAITGDYTQTGGTLNLDIGGTTPGDTFDQLTVSGVATLGGALNVGRVNDFTPTSGQTFRILTFRSRGGTFATTTIDSGFNSPPTYNDTDVTVVAS